MYLARVNGQVHRVGFSTGYWRDWVVQDIFEVVRKITKSKLGRECWQQSSRQFDLSWCERMSQQGVNHQQTKTGEARKAKCVKIRERLLVVILSSQVAGLFT